jgi:hypothetical protein
MEGCLWRPSGCPAARLDNLPKETFISNIGIKKRQATSIHESPRRGIFSETRVTIHILFIDACCFPHNASVTPCQ